QGGADGVADSLKSAGQSAHHIPLVGGAVSEPLTAASKAALDIAGAGHSLDSTASWLAVVLALAVAAPPTLGVGVGQPAAEPAHRRHPRPGRGMARSGPPRHPWPCRPRIAFGGNSGQGA